MILDDFTVSGVSLEEFKRQQKGTILEPFATMMWNTMSEVQYNLGQEKLVIEVRDHVVRNLESLHEMLNIAILFVERKLKRVQWEKLGEEYCQEICRSLVPIIKNSLQDYQKVVYENKVLHGYEQDIAYIANYLESMPTPDSLVVDEVTGVMTSESLEETIRAVNKVIRKLKDITGKDLTVGILISRFHKGGVPQNNKYYREIYDVLDRFNFIPSETKQIHSIHGSLYYRENYIKSFVFREKNRS